MIEYLRAAAWVSFWISAFAIAYTYFLYPVLLFVLFSAAQVRRDLRYLAMRSNRRAPLSLRQWPKVSIIMPAHDEETHLPAKLENLKELEYESGMLEIIIVSDGSTDRTNEFLSHVTDPRVTVVILDERQGKPNALNQAVAQASGDVLLFCDAATLFQPDTVRMLARHFVNPNVGVVCGALRFEGSTESKQTEGTYWKYETVLRLMESRLGATLTASGALYAMRRSAYSPIAKNTIIEDLIIPMGARKLGLAVLYDPEAIGVEYAASTVAGEFTRRVRLAIGSFRSIGQLLRIPVDFYTALALVSHKLLRWFVFLFAIVLFVSNMALLNRSIYQLAFLLQIAFYLSALVGYLLRDRAHNLRLVRLGYFLVAMNWAFVLGLYRCLAGRDNVKWQRVA
ncbi:MAG TPA: glycosyltransferase family 2 protein [Clostridia bacterium]|nr:glycosyltransferase family 2 protein [Clostridia bacterium]